MQSRKMKDVRKSKRSQGERPKLGAILFSGRSKTGFFLENARTSSVRRDLRTRRVARNRWGARTVAWPSRKATVAMLSFIYPRTRLSNKHTTGRHEREWETRESTHTLRIRANTKLVLSTRESFGVPADDKLANSHSVTS